MRGVFLTFNSQTGVWLGPWALINMNGNAAVDHSHCPLTTVARPVAWRSSKRVPPSTRCGSRARVRIGAPAATTPHAPELVVGSLSRPWSRRSPPAPGSDHPSTEEPNSEVRTRYYVYRRQPRDNYESWFEMLEREQGNSLARESKNGTPYASTPPPRDARIGRCWLPRRTTQAPILEAIFNAQATSHNPGATGYAAR